MTLTEAEKELIELFINELSLALGADWVVDVSVEPADFVADYCTERMIH